MKAYEDVKRFDLSEVKLEMHKIYTGGVRQPLKNEIRVKCYALNLHYSKLQIA